MGERLKTRYAMLTSHDLTGLSRKPDASLFALKVLVWAAGLLTGLGGMLFGGGVIEFCSAVMAGAFTAHGVELSHQALHGTGLRGSRANRLVGILLASPMFVSYSEYQVNHLYHHKALGTPDDKEFWNYGTDRNASVAGVLRHLLLVDHYGHAIRSTFRALTGGRLPNVPLDYDGRVRQEYRFIFLALCLGVGTALAADQWVGLLAWFGSLMLVAGPIHALIELPEHHGCDKTNPSIFSNTRTIKSNRFMTWFTNGNNFHVEHHAAAGLQMEDLRNLHARISDRIEVYCPTYRSFYWASIKAWMKSYSQNELAEVEQ